MNKYDVNFLRIFFKVEFIRLFCCCCSIWWNGCEIVLLLVYWILYVMCWLLGYFKGGDGGWGCFGCGDCCVLYVSFWSWDVVVWVFVEMVMVMVCLWMLYCVFLFFFEGGNVIIWLSFVFLRICSIKLRFKCFWGWCFVLFVVVVNVVLNN